MYRPQVRVVPARVRRGWVIAQTRVSDPGRLPRVGNVHPALGESCEGARTTGQIATAERSRIDRDLDAQLGQDLRFEPTT